MNGPFPDFTTNTESSNWPPGDLEKRFRRVELKGNYDYNCKKLNNRKKEDSQLVQVINTKEILSDLVGLVTRHRDTLQRRKKEKNLREEKKDEIMEEEGFTGVRNMLIKFEVSNAENSSQILSPRIQKKPIKPPRPGFLPKPAPRNPAQAHAPDYSSPPRSKPPPPFPPCHRPAAQNEEYGTLNSIASIQTELQDEISSEDPSTESINGDFSYQQNPPVNKLPVYIDPDGEALEEENKISPASEFQSSPDTPRKETSRRMSDETYERIMREFRGPELVLTDQNEQKCKEPKKAKRRRPIRPTRPAPKIVPPIPPKAPILEIIKSRENTPDLVPAQTRKEILKIRLSSFYAKDEFLKRKDYHFAIAEFLETIERTAESLRLLDSFYHQYGNDPEFAAIIASLPKIHRQNLPELCRIHIRFLSKAGVTDGWSFKTPRSSSDSSSKEDHLEHLLDPIQIPQLIRSTYLDDPEFFDLLEKTIHEKAFDPVQESPHFNLLFLEFSKFLAKENGQEKNFGLDLMNISDLPYTRIFNLMNILEKVKKEAVKHEFENAAVCKRMFDEYQWTVKE